MRDTPRWLRGTMDTIALELAGDAIAITFRPTVGQATTRRIDLASALELSALLLRGSGLTVMAKIAIPGMTLRVENGRSPLAWLSMSSEHDPDLVACIKGHSVREIGRRLHDHWLCAKGAMLTGPERSIFVRPVSYFCIDGEEVEADPMG